MKKADHVMVVGKFDKESFATHIVQTLDVMGYRALPYHYGTHYSHKKGKLAFTYNKFQLVLESVTWNTGLHEKRVKRSLEKSIRNTGVQLTIVTHDFLKPAEVDLIRSLTNAPVVLWFPDALVNLARHMFLNASYDALFFKDPFLVKRLQADFPGKNIWYLPECCNPLVHRLYEPTGTDAGKFTCDITTAGNLYANRVAFFEQLCDMNLDIRIWGNPGSRWMKLDKIAGFLRNEYIMEREKGLAFRLAKVVLNNLHPGEVAGINCRAFEVPAMGGFQVINWRSGLDDLFEPGKEVIAFHSLEELKEQLRFYLSNEQERLRISHNGHMRAHAQHTYEHRLKLILETVFQNKKGFILPQDTELVKII
ncbi:MAG TPA: glycosyltransferase [Chitinophagaceae bacterium]|nr:glycosyltransferase [Chitinophagaceae bacterium]